MIYHRLIRLFRRRRPSKPAPPRFIRTTCIYRVKDGHCSIQITGVFDTKNNRRSTHTLHLN